MNVCSPDRTSRPAAIAARIDRPPGGRQPAAGRGDPDEQARRAGSAAERLVERGHERDVVARQEGVDVLPDVRRIEHRHDVVASVADHAVGGLGAVRPEFALGEDHQSAAWRSVASGQSTELGGAAASCGGMQGGCHSRARGHWRSRHPRLVYGRSAATHPRAAIREVDHHGADVKETYRQVEQDAREAWRRSDGDEDLKDKLGNVGDEARRTSATPGTTWNMPWTGIRSTIGSPAEPIQRSG